jgi:hypothetical protein
VPFYEVIISLELTYVSRIGVFSQPATFPSFNQTEASFGGQRNNPYSYTFRY